MARLAQRAENAWVGAMTGIMDQLISACGEADSALLDRLPEFSNRPRCRYRTGTVVVVMDTATRHRHVDSGYNDRRRQCEEAAAFFGVPALRDVSEAQFRAREADLSEPTRRRARHVITENDRTEAAGEGDEKRGDAEKLGQLMSETSVTCRCVTTLKSRRPNSIRWSRSRRPKEVVLRRADDRRRVSRVARWRSSRRTDVERF